MRLRVVIAALGLVAGLAACTDRGGPTASGPELPAGWRWESYLDVELAVPGDWGYGGFGRWSAWCAASLPRWRSRWNIWRTCGSRPRRRSTACNSSDWVGWNKRTPMREATSCVIDSASSRSFRTELAGSKGNSFSAVDPRSASSGECSARKLKLVGIPVNQGASPGVFPFAQSLGDFSRVAFQTLRINLPQKNTT